MSETASDSEESRLDAYSKQVTSPLRRLFRRYGGAHARWLWIGLFASVVTHATTLVTPIVLGTTIDAVFTDQGTYSLPLVPQAWLPATPTAQFWLSAALIGGTLFLSALMGWIRGVTMNFFAHGVMYDVRTDTYEKIQRLDMPFFDEKETGEIMSVLNNDTSNLEIFLDNALSESVRVGVLVVGITALLLVTNWQLALITLVTIPLMVGFTWWFMRAIEPRYAAQRREVGNLNTRLENSLGGIELIKTTNTEAYENERFRDVSRDLFDAEMAAMKLSYFYRPGMKFLTGIALLATFLLGGIWVFSGPPLFFSGELTVGNFVVFMLLTQRLTGPLARLSNIVDWYENARASGKRICGLLDIPVGIQDAPDATALADVDGRIEYDTVHFAYGTDNEQTDDEYGDNGQTDNEKQVLDGIDLLAEPGETVALVGPTGSGKSTTAKLLLRLYDVDDGAVRVDGHDVRSVTAGSLRASIGYVGQDTYLFDGTVAANIRYGQFDASDETVRNAARAAEAHEFITGFPDGYDTEVGERGVKLSGGQKQRLAIARAILQDPDIVILDEATASVDTETELAIQHSLEEVTAGRTTLAIAHRLSTIKDADRILVLEDGQIRERGTHQELLDQDGLYATLWAIQSGNTDDVATTSKSSPTGQG